jgi:hypothetical protein
MDMLDAHQQVEYRRRAMPIVPRLLKAMPTIKDRWVAYLKYWDGRSEGDYLDMSEFAQHLVEKLRAGETSEFPTLFQAVEDLYRQDDDVIDEVLTVGLLEDIQNVAANTGVQSSRFRQWLGPITTNRWELLHRDWGTTDT